MCISGNDLAQQQQNELDRLLRTDPAGLAEVDAICLAFGLTEPTVHQRQAALQVMWPLQVTFASSQLLSRVWHPNPEFQFLRRVAARLGASLVPCTIFSPAQVTGATSEH